MLQVLELFYWLLLQIKITQLGAQPAIAFTSSSDFGLHKQVQPG